MSLVSHFGYVTLPVMYRQMSGFHWYSEVNMFHWCLLMTEDLKTVAL